MEPENGWTRLDNMNPADRDELRKAGLKITQPRILIMEILGQSRAKHMTADDVYRALMEADEDIGLATVYRVLNQFEAAGLVIKHHFEGGQAFYELETGDHHDHMICVETGKVVEFVSDEIEALQHKIAERHGFELEDHSLVMYVRPKRKS